MLTGGSGRAGNRTTAAVLVIVTVAAAVVLLAYAYSTGTKEGAGGPSLMDATCSSLPNEAGPVVEHVSGGGSGGHAYFLIVAADPPSPYAGFNGSYYAGTSAQWVTLNVRVGQNVSIRVINCASHEAHGFAISYYADKSLVSIQPGQSYDLSFAASKAGTFRIYCSVYCAIHAFMQNEALVVT
ncbi:MAG: hypothetical protein JRM80_06430 [Nitrososphaerota archaeon]|nr:hypothetical protein [Nitrososphaerota archaeon]